MRGDSSSEHKKEAPVYLAVMSAEPNVLGEESSPVHHDDTRPQPLLSLRPQQQDGGTAGSKSATHSSNGPGIEPKDEEEDLQTQISSGVHDSLRASSDDANDKSAFRITEVSPFTGTDELEQSKGMSHEADSFIEVTKQRGQSESSESDETRAALFVTTGVPQPVREQDSEINERGLPLEGAPNGPVAQQPVRRFRRVNKYERGRWIVEDTLVHRETEERPESEMRGTVGAQTSGGVVGRESPFSQRRKGGGEGDDQELHSRSSSDVGGGGGGTVVEQGEKGDHSDRTGSVLGGGGGGEILSRNTSMSSLTTAGDKSVDGDHLGDQLRNESESEMGYLPPQASAGYSTPATAVSSPPQHPRHAVASYPATSSSSSVAISGQQPTSTIPPDSRIEETQQDPESKTGVHRVEKALSHLNKELQRLVEENKEITQLKDLNRILEEKNQKLEQEKQRLEDEKRDMQRRLDELATQNRQLRTKNERLIQELLQKGEQLTAELQNLSSSTTTSHS